MTNTPAKPTIVVHLDGGLVQYVESDAHVNVVIVDYDLEGAGEDEIKTLPDGSRATVRQEAAADVSRESAQRWMELAT
ncbi:hypothetical protein ACIP1U_16055 [Cupriavidus sp. NPDC089707]|uniref:hypothetical protein n=1 Tax=Cupriavidus sp. NPDC089707 TaxID=3363963 RepID=UPI003811CCA1